MNIDSITHNCYLNKNNFLLHNLITIELLSTELFTSKLLLSNIALLIKNAFNFAYEIRRYHKKNNLKRNKKN